MMSGRIAVEPVSDDADDPPAAGVLVMNADVPDRMTDPGGVSQNVSTSALGVAVPWPWVYSSVTCSYAASAAWMLNPSARSDSVTSPVSPAYSASADTLNASVRAVAARMPAWRAVCAAAR